MEKAELQKLLSGLEENVPLKNHTTFKIGGPAQYFFEAKTKKDLIKAITAAKKFQLPFFILAGGSNLLVSDRGCKGLVIKYQTSDVRCQGNKIYTAAGLALAGLVDFSIKKSLIGLEWAAGIPGTVGGAVYGNAGAFGFCMADIIKEVEVFDPRSLEIKKFFQKDCQFGNKNSVFKQKNLVILSAVFGLKKGDKKQIQDKIKERLVYRRERHPLNLPSAGCAFKNWTKPIEDRKLLREFPELKEFNKKGVTPAAYLIEKCGLKGRTIGQAQISEKHANFIVNLGGAKAQDVLKLINLAKREVKNKFKINLEEEIQFLGF